MHVSKLAFTNISRNIPFRAISRACLRMARVGEMNVARTITPASCSRRAVSAARRTFSARSSIEKPRSAFSFFRRSSASKLNTTCPWANRCFSNASAIVDFPAPESPVNQKINGSWLYAAQRSLKLTLPLFR